MRWQWAYLEYPASEQAQESLLDAYIDHHAYGAARVMVDELLARPSPCLMCVLHAAEEAATTHQSALAGMLLDRLDSSGLRRDREVAESYLDIRKRIATDEGDSLALRHSFDAPGDTHFARKAVAFSARGESIFEPPVATTAPPDPLLSFARAQHSSYHALHPAAVVASFPQVVGASVLAL